VKKKTRKKAQAKRNAADANLVTAAEHRNPRKPPGGPARSTRCSRSRAPVTRVPSSTPLKNVSCSGTTSIRPGPPAEDGKSQGNNKKEGDKEEEFPEIHNCFMIYGGQVANASARHRKQERREVCSVKVAAPVYLDWSDKPITFDRGDHPDFVPSPGRYPLVVDPVIGNIRLSKVFMDGGSSLNIVYAETLELLGVISPRSGPVQHPSTGSHLESVSSPSGRLTYPSASELPPTSERKPSPSRWLGSKGPTTR
jgi:hypothetical protein